MPSLVLIALTVRPYRQHYIPTNRQTDRQTVKRTYLPKLKILVSNKHTGWKHYHLAIAGDKNNDDDDDDNDNDSDNGNDNDNYNHTIESGRQRVSCVNLQMASKHIIVNDHVKNGMWIRRNIFLCTNFIVLCLKGWNLQIRSQNICIDGDDTFWQSSRCWARDKAQLHKPMGSSRLLLTSNDNADGNKTI